MIFTAVLLWSVLIALKCFHAISVIRWLLRNGAEVARQAGSPKHDVATNKVAFWKAFEHEAALDDSPFLFFGVKDITLDHWAAALRAKKLYAVMPLFLLLKFIWHAAGMVAVTATLLYVLSYLPTTLDESQIVIAFVCGLLILFLMFLLGIEMIVLVITVGAWVPYYHRLDINGKYRKKDSAVREKFRLLYVSAGASIMTLVSMASVISFVARRTTAVTLTVDDNPMLGVLQSFAHAVTVLGTVGEGLEAGTVYGAILTIVLLPVVLTYIAFLVPIAASVVDIPK